MFRTRRLIAPPPKLGLGAVALAAALAPTVPAVAAESLWSSVLEKLDVKAAPAGAAPDFVERSRPDPDSTGYLPTASPHKVSPLAVKTPDEVQAAKDALDAAKARQLNPGAPKGLAAAKVGKTKAAAAAD